MRFHAHTADREPCEPRPGFGNHLETRYGYRFGLGRTMDIYELGQDILDPVCLDQALCFLWQHGHDSWL
ncbi:hypothetical protein D9M71_118620 [compost metagenome]